VWEYATRTRALRVLSELAPPDFGSWWNWPLAILLLWAAATCVVRRFPLVDTAILVVGAAFSLRMQRDIWFGALAAAAVLTRLPQVAPSDVSRQLGRLIFATLAALALTRLVWHVGPGAGRPPAALTAA